MRCTFFILLIGLTSNIGAQPTGFRNIEWGTPKSEVNRIDPDLQSEGLMDFDMLINPLYVLAGHQCLYTYFFLEGKLQAGSYRMTSDISHSNEDYVKAFDDWLGILEDKYGSATDKGEKWIDDKNNRYADRTHHIRMGELSIYADWEFEDGSQISLVCEEQDNDIHTSLTYRSKTLIEYLSKKSDRDF